MIPACLLLTESDMVGSVSHGQDEKLERKRLKKLKRQEAARAEASHPPQPAAHTPNVNGGVSPPRADANGEGKPQKKKKKRKQQSNSTSFEPDIEAEGQKSKMKKKQDSLSSHAKAVQDATNALHTAKQSTDASTASNQTAAASPEGVNPKKKKSRPIAAAPATLWAAVGNHEVARTGRRVDKALYTEDPAVTRMTDAAVQQWRDERQTAVTGCEIKPVTAFSEAGIRSFTVQKRR